MKKKIMKALAVVACAILLVVGSIAGTIAYLTDTAKVVNTFTVGNVDIELSEEGATKNDEGVLGQSYHLLPGSTYPKAPIITLEANSEACWLFINVENGLSKIEIGEDESTEHNTIHEQILANGWTALADNAGVYYRKVEKKVEADTLFSTFANVTISSAVNNSELAGFSEAKIVVTAYAIQLKELSVVAEAWSAVYSAYNSGSDSGN